MLATSAYSKTFLLLLLLCTLFIATVEPLSFNIQNFNDTENAGLINFGGEAKIQNGSILLNSLTTQTNDGVSVGRAIYAQPLLFKNSSTGYVTNFSTRFSFTIDAAIKTTYGDGFAFYVAALDFQIPTTADNGSTLGIYGDTQNKIIAVEFDTYINDEDPPVTHVGINTNAVASLTYAKFDIETNLGKMCHVLITYDASAKVIHVWWLFDGSTSNNSLSHQIDLAQILPDWVTVGFSGSTGSAKEQNVIHSWEFNSSLVLNSLDGNVNKKNDDMTSGHKSQVKLVVVIVVICSAMLVFVVVSISWLVVKKKRRKEEYGFGLERAAMPRRFGYNELASATNGFADDRRLGEGGSGQVYKGFLSDSGSVVAVKRIFSDVEHSERVFTNEVKIISRLMHRNLLQFMGWCHEKGELMLVFEYMANGSLDTHLFGNRRTLTWSVRYNIALGVAKALHYLHEDAEQCVLHRDIKSSNILLDTDFNTKISDFGIAKLVDPRLRTQKSMVVGTYGYLAPEYVNEGRVSKESDMYAFGVVALEIACGRKSHMQDEENHHVHLAKWVWKHYKEGNILSAADKKLDMDFDVDEMTCLLTVGLWCTLQDHKKRPRAQQVINVLKQEALLPMLCV